MACSGVGALTAAFLEVCIVGISSPEGGAIKSTIKNYDSSIETTNSRTGLPPAKQQGGSWPIHHQKIGLNIY